MTASIILTLSTSQRLMNYTETIFTALPKNLYRTSEWIRTIISIPYHPINGELYQLSYGGMFSLTCELFFQFFKVSIQLLHFTQPVKIKYHHRFILSIRLLTPLIITKLTAIQATNNNVPKIPIIAYSKINHLHIVHFGKYHTGLHTNSWNN